MKKVLTNNNNIIIIKSNHYLILYYRSAPAHPHITEREQVPRYVLLLAVEICIATLTLFHG